MFCRNCGNQLPDGTKFCTSCGAQQTNITPPAAEEPTQTSAPAAKQAEPVYAQPSQPSQPAQPEKKKNNIWITIIILVIAGTIGSLVGKYVFAPDMTPNPGPGGTSHTTKNDIPSAEYNKVFEGTGIVHYSSLFASGATETTSFAQKTADGTIACADFAHKGDTVKAWKQTLYKPLPTDATEEKKNVAIQELKKAFTDLEALSCCTIKYTYLNNYLCITIDYSNVDTQQTISELYSHGLIESRATISMSQTSSELIRQGMVKK